MRSSSTYYGNQKKFLSDSSLVWTKKDLIGGEAVTEVLVSEFLESCINQWQFGSGFVRYF